MSIFFFNVVTPLRVNVTIYNQAFPIFSGMLFLCVWMNKGEVLKRLECSILTSLGVTEINQN